MKEACILIFVLGLVAATYGSSPPLEQYPAGGTMILLGVTGAGKSQLGNLMSQKSMFEVGGGMNGVTNFTMGAPFEWNDASYRIFDNAGLDDGQHRDTAIIIEMHQKLHDVVDCRGFIYVRNEQVPRLAGSERQMLQHLRDVFGQVFIDNLVIVSTRAMPDELLDKDDRVAREKRRAEIDEHFSQELGVDRTFPKFFIDTSPKADYPVRRAANGTVDSIMMWMAANKPFALGEMQIVASKVDTLNAKIEDAQAAQNAAEVARLNEEMLRLKAELDRDAAEKEAKQQRDNIEKMQIQLVEERKNWDNMLAAERQEWKDRLREANKQSGVLQTFCTFAGLALGGPPGAVAGNLLGSMAEEL